MENSNIREETIIGNFMFCDEEYMRANFQKVGLEKLEGFSKETILQSAILDDSLQGQAVFYMLMSDYIYNILIPARDGHKLLISQANENKQMLNVYSLNYYEVISQEDNFKRRIR